MERGETDNRGASWIVRDEYLIVEDSGDGVCGWYVVCGE